MATQEQPDEIEDDGNANNNDDVNSKLIPHSKNNNQNPKLYVERRSFWGMSYKCMALFNAYFMLFDFAFEFIYFTAVCTN